MAQMSTMLAKETLAIICPVINDIPPNGNGSSGDEHRSSGRPGNPTNDPPAAADSADPSVDVKNTLDELGRSWELLGKEDPLWAILSDPAKRGGGWEIEEFLATGQQETVKVIAHLEERSLNPQRHRSLDFGCGVGRVTHALARYFDRVDGVDLSQAMIEKANTLHSHIRNLFFHHSTSRVLPFVDETFDLVYSRLVLQHMATDIALSYIGEFVRVLRPGGVAVFQAPSRCLVDQEVKPSEIHLSGDSAFIEMHAHPPEVIERTVEDCGGRIADVRDDPCAGEAFESLKYTVVR